MKVPKMTMRKGFSRNERSYLRRLLTKVKSARRRTDKRITKLNESIIYSRYNPRVTPLKVKARDNAVRRYKFLNRETRKLETKLGK